MKYKLLIGIIIGLLAASGIIIVNRAGKPAASAAIQGRKIQIVASMYPLYFFAKEIAAGNAYAHNITPAGSEPHGYELRTQDMSKIERADLVIINGLVEPWAERITDQSIERGRPLLIIAEGLKDPHVWLSPRLAKIIVEKIAGAASRIDGQNKAAYSANAKALMEKLDALDAKFRQELSSCGNKNFVASHAAFGHMAKEYGLNQMSIAGLSADAEPTALDLIEAAKFAREHQIKYIFFETLVSPKLAETLSREIGAQTLVLNPLEGLTPDEEKQGKNYFTEMEQNLKNLRIALACQ